MHTQIWSFLLDNDIVTLAKLWQADMNVSLTAISLLWNAADLLAKRSVHEEVQQSGDEAPSALGNGDAAVAVGTLDSVQFEELLRILFRALQVCCFSRHFTDHCTWEHSQQATTHHLSL